ncbi:hypothetical protein O3G_MSEX002929 [Manduca sexta]|uniref:Uncharacterized protein n=1 Tax=Manduca sexta TaxID=7130 RepID=A0A921YR27_MANSE|nr:hypothetical protein O3G_MSEX002929 [Manduca sexta]
MYTLYLSTVTVSTYGLKFVLDILDSRTTCTRGPSATGCIKQQTGNCGIPWERSISSSGLQQADDGDDDNDDDDGGGGGGGDNDDGDDGDDDDGDGDDDGKGISPYHIRGEAPMAKSVCPGCTSA